MDFKKIVAKINYSPNMLWKLSEYDKKNNKEIRKTKWILLLLFFLLVLNCFIFKAHSIKLQNNKNYNKNIETTTNSLNNVLIKNNKLFIKDKNIYKKLGINDNYNFKLINNLKLNNNWIEISSNNLYKDSKRVDLNNNIFIRKAQKKYYGDVAKITTKNNIFYILNNGNILSKIDIVKNKTVNLSSYYKAKIDAKKATVISGDSLILSLNIEKKKLLPKELAKYNILYLDLSDFLEYAKLNDETVLENNKLILDFSNKSNIQKNISFTIKNNPKKINSNIPTSSNCKLEAKVINSKISIKHNSCFKESHNIIIDSISDKTSSYLSEGEQWSIIKYSILILIITWIIKSLYLIRLLTIKLEIKKIRSNINQGVL